MTPSLFSPGPRQDRRLRADLSAYDRVNQSPFPHDAHARELIDCWWRALPPPARASIAKRFVNKRREQHLGAFFQLYMSAMTARLFSGVKLDVGQEDDLFIPQFIWNLCQVRLRVWHEQIFCLCAVNRIAKLPATSRAAAL